LKYPRYSKTALTRTLQWCAASVVLCAVAVGFASSRQTAALHRHDLAAANVQVARSRLGMANEHRALIDEYGDRYAQLVREGLLIRFDRAVASDWFETDLPARHGAVIDGYVIGKDALFSGSEAAGLTAFRIVSHRLDFSASLADEDEFADLMSTIQKRLPGTTAQEACSVTRNVQARDYSDALNLHCALVWYEFAPSNTELAANQPGT
jgi:hypothetical protein